MEDNLKKIAATLISSSSDSDISEDDEIFLKMFKCSESDTDSSDSEIEDQVHEMTVLHLLAMKNKRNCIKDYVEKTVESYTEEEFGTHFRLSKFVFQDLVSKFEDSEEYLKMNTKNAYSAHVHITLFLWFAAHEAVSFRDMADRFDLSKGTISYMIVRVIYFVSNLSSNIISWPTEEQKLKTVSAMEQKCGIKGIIGAMDGTHIKIMPPKENKDDYIDRKNTTSLCLQAICNEERKFIDIFVGFPGSAHDSRVFQNSDIYPKLPHLCGNYFILADSAYKCSKYVLTPYRDNGHLSRQQKNFNRKLSTGRVMIEHSFGMLKQRFRQLYYCKLKGIEKICHFIRACCVLHNLCDEKYLNMDFEMGSNDDDIEEIDYEEGSAYRDQICKDLIN